VKFIDQVTIQVEAGNGGAGSSHFRREKFVPLGGPDGGDGGIGGSVILRGDEGKGTLLDLTYSPRIRAGHGQPGAGKKKSGRGGSDAIIRVPLGTQAFDEESGALLADITFHDQVEVIAKGGRGGKGNDFFKSATNQAPTYAQPGESGERKSVTLTLKLIADVGLVGFPNAGKSTLLSCISKARPKIADYPFTTLTPQLGVVSPFPGSSFVVADIPGLIEGAHQGKGLGVDFLKHIERTKAIFHLVDISDSFDESTSCYNPDKLIDKVNYIRKELESFSTTLASLPYIIGISKIDIVNDRNVISRAKQALEAAHHTVLPFSSSTGEGLPECLTLLDTLVRKLRTSTISSSINDLSHE
jgi:GTPase